MTDHESTTLEPEDGRLRPLLGTLLMRARLPLILLFAAATVFFAWQASQLQPDASFEKMLPTSHPYIQNFLNRQDDLKGLGNSVRIIVESRNGDIFTAEFQDLLKQITDEVFYVNGVDRSALQSLWTPNTRWMEVTEEGCGHPRRLRRQRTHPGQAARKRAQVGADRAYRRQRFSVHDYCCAPDRDGPEYGRAARLRTVLARPGRDGAREVPV